VTCDSCGFEWIGATKRDALAEGWRIRILRGGREFFMCGACEGHFELVWALRGEAQRQPGAPSA
jgi:hypothetical protein